LANPDVLQTECLGLDTRGTIQFIIASRMEDVRLIGLSVSRLCSFHGFSEMDTFGIELCVVEAVTNAIEHAYHCQLNHEVKVVLNLHPDGVEIEVRDRGDAMDSSLLQEAGYARLDLNPEAEEILSDRGRGLSIIKEMMDEVSYVTNGEENCLVMTKKLRSPPEGDSPTAADQED
jgi:serine/threonine-protein kinase RsbW